MRICIGIILLSSFLIFTLWGKPLKVEVSAPAALLMNTETGAILYAKNIHERQYPASITKIATALYVLEQKGERLDTVASASAHALVTIPAHVRQTPDSGHPPYRLEIGGSTIGLRPGEELTLKTLLYGLMLASGNDAANVLAEYTNGSIDQFMRGLNQFLYNNGIRESHFVNPHGLHHPSHWTTAYDMALITQKALRHPAFREVVKTTRYLCPKTAQQPAHYFVQTNRLVKPGPYFYPKAIGVKTGYTSKAGHTLVGAATHGGRTLIAVLLGCSDSEQRFREAVRLFEAAFAEKPVQRILFAKESDCFSRSIRGAKKSLSGILQENLVLEYYPAEEPSFRAEIEWLPCKLPVQAQARVGTLRLVATDGKVLNQLPLIAAEKVSPHWWFLPINFMQRQKPLCLALFLGAQVALLLFYFLKKNQKVGEG